MNKKINVGQRFGRLVTVKKVDNYSRGNYKWVCICDCGKERVALSGSLNYGQTKSCGCIQLESVTKHGQAKRGNRSSEYVSWRCMIGRCYTPQTDSYKFYGERGITVCDRWLNSFEMFFQDMGVKPSKKHTIERLDVLGNYEPNNCKWATQAEQDRNKANNNWIEHNGEKMIASDWAKRLGVSCGRLLLYVKAHGVDDSIKYFTDKSALRFKTGLIKEIYLSAEPYDKLSQDTGVSIRNIIKIKKRETFKKITDEILSNTKKVG